MANTKNYSLREKIIDTYLRRGWYTRQQIEDACNRALMAHEHAKVLAPESLKAKIKARIAENLKNYE